MRSTFLSGGLTVRQAKHSHRHSFWASATLGFLVPIVLAAGVFGWLGLSSAAPAVGTASGAAQLAPLGLMGLSKPVSAAAPAGTTPTTTPTPTIPTPTATVCGGTPTWRNEPALLTGRSAAAGAVANNSLYVLSGFNDAPDYVASTEMFNGTTWSTVAPIPTPHSQAKAAVLGNVIYVPGGYNSVQYSGALTSMQIYTTTANTWGMGAPLPEARSGAAVAAYNNRVYVIAGFGPGFQGRGTVYEYNPATNTYATKAPMPGGATAGNVPGVEYNGEIYVVGGAQTAGAYAYNPTADTWRTLAALPQTDCQAGGAFVFGDEIWVVGCLGYPLNGQVWVYNPGSNTWRAGTLYNQDHEDGSAVGVYNGRGFVAGGAGSPVSNVVESLGGGGSCVTPTSTPTGTNTPILTNTPTSTPTRTHTVNVTNTTIPTNTATNTPVPPTPTPTACPIQFTDVNQSNPFYPYIRCLACRGIVAGYTTSPPCTTGVPCFLWSNNVTRGQMAKFVANSANYQDVIPPSRQTFTDVAYGSPFWLFVERAYLHGVIQGYQTSPPCPAGATPCFLPANNVTRGQTAKFVSQAANYQDVIPPNQQTFTDVIPNSTFWVYIERVYLHGVVIGYNTSPPCPAGGIPCFLPANNVTRGQTAKFISNAFFPNCYTPRAPKN